MYTLDETVLLCPSHGQSHRLMNTSDIGGASQPMSYWEPRSQSPRAVRQIQPGVPIVNVQNLQLPEVAIVNVHSVQLPEVVVILLLVNLDPSRDTPLYHPGQRPYEEAPPHRRFHSRCIANFNATTLQNSLQPLLHQ